MLYLLQQSSCDGTSSIFAHYMCVAYFSATDERYSEGSLQSFETYLTPLYTVVGAYSNSVLRPRG